jgi:hypothetical protein
MASATPIASAPLMAKDIADTPPPSDSSPTPSLAAKVTNFVIFQLVYAACVLGAVEGNHWLGPVAGAVLLPINLWFFRRKDRGGELRLWLLAGVLGFVLDSGLLSLNAVGFPDVTRIAPDAAISAWLVPPWIVTLWVAVGTMLRTSLSWLRDRPALAATLGAIGGPFSFWTGTRLGATELPLGWGSYSLLSFEYAVVTPLLLRIAHAPSHAPAPPS